MLGQRILTAIVLLIVLAGAIATDDPMWLLGLMALAAACANWEWLRLTLPERLQGAVPVVVSALVFVVMLAQAWTWTWDEGGVLPGELLALGVLILVVAAVWLVGATSAVVRGRADAPAANIGWMVFAVPATFVAWTVLALMFLMNGAWYLVSLLGLVWAADICAYFGGRAFGRRKLAPRVSPGKTIEGAIAGLAGAVAWTLLSAGWPGSYGEALVERWSLWGAVLAALLLGAASIMGDLFESLLKRRAGRKDSSALLPGHGGVYDRIDAILPVAPFALILSGVMF